MKKKILSLLLKLSQRHGKDYYIKMFDDYSGGIYDDHGDKLAFDFFGEQELIDLLKNE